MHFFQLNEIVRTLHSIEHKLNNSSHDFWQLITVIIAILIGITSPWLSEYFRRLPKKSKLEAINIDVKKQLQDYYILHPSLILSKNDRVLLHVGRLVIKNNEQFAAKSVEAYLNAVEDNGKPRENFLPVPLHWTHGQLNASKSTTVRDIYPQQVVYLDIFNEIYDRQAAKNTVEFAIAAGHGINDFSKLSLSESKLFVKIYQESGQVNQIALKIDWDGVDVPAMSIIGQESIK